MNTPSVHTLPARLNSLAAMCGLLERLEHQRSTATPEQYRSVAQQVKTMLAAAEPDAHLQALLKAAPASATLYENLRYDIAGLCRAPLEQALNAELAATAAIRKARLAH